jgi:hypothetical protein
MSPATAKSVSSIQQLSTPLKWAVGSWSFFIAENVILSENRTMLIQDIFKGNDDYYHYVYGLCSTTAVGSIIYAYKQKIQPFSSNAKNQHLLLWKNAAAGAPLLSRALGFVTLSLGLGFMSQTVPKLQIPVEYIGSSGSGSGSGSGSDSGSENRPSDTRHQPSQLQRQPTKSTDSNTNSKWKVRCPFDFTDSKSKILQSANNNHDKNDNDNTQQPLTIHDIHGMDRITRHPGLWSFGLLGVGASFLSPCLPTRIYLTMPLLMSLIGGHHNDSRFRRNIGGSLPKEYDDLTSNVPFWAMLIEGSQCTGSQDRIQLIQDFYNHEVKGLNLVLSMGVAALFVARKGRVGGAIGGLRAVR